MLKVFVIALRIHCCCYKALWMYRLHTDLVSVSSNKISRQHKLYTKEEQGLLPWGNRLIKNIWLDLILDFAV